MEVAWIKVKKDGCGSGESTCLTSRRSDTTSPAQAALSQSTKFADLHAFPTIASDGARITYNDKKQATPSQSWKTH